MQIEKETRIIDLTVEQLILIIAQRWQVPRLRNPNKMYRSM